MSRFACPLLVLAALSAGPVPAGAQDVELLGRMNGTVPPPGYFARIAADPAAFTFSQETGAPLIRSRVRAAGGGGQAATVQAGVLGPRDEPVRGAFAFPIVLAQYADSPPPPFTRARIQQHMFDGPNPTGTVPEFYSAASGGRVQMSGAALPWVATDLTAAEVAGGSSGLGLGSRVAPFIRQAVARLDTVGVDWGRYDNDGADGIPNSGDDDGVVDVLTVLHPTPGGECTSPERDNRVWSHRWTLSALSGSGYNTRTPAAAGGIIRVDDYTIQPALSCDEVSINPIGVFVHELAHGFGLPDLYAVGGEHAGVGQWDLMGTGPWGCPGVFRPERPCPLGAWSRVALGWAQVVDLPADADLGVLRLAPAALDDRVFRIPVAGGPGDHVLLEHRARAGLDGDVPAEGLLVWQVNAELLARRWASNLVNADPDRMAVWLRQADGADELALPDGGRGDAGDVFTGAPGFDAFHVATAAPSVDHEGRPLGFTLLDIVPSGVNYTFHALSRFQSVTVRTVGADGIPGLVTLGGAPVGAGSIIRAPFSTLELVAALGVPIAPGVRTGFQGWEDGGAATRTFTVGTVDSTLTATYGNREVQVEVTMFSPVPDIVPGVLEVSPGTVDGWGPAGSQVEVSVVPRNGFRFLGWSGDLEGEPNPTLVTLTHPVVAAATFEVTYGFAATTDSLEVPAAETLEVALEVANANLPVLWSLESGTLPDGLRLEGDGVLRGAALETGAFDTRIRATDALGLTAVQSLVVDVVAPAFSVEGLVTPFLEAGALPTAMQLQFLDHHGNQNGSYDVGDLRAYLLAHPNLREQEP